MVRFRLHWGEVMLFILNGSFIEEIESKRTLGEHLVQQDIKLISSQVSRKLPFAVV